MSAYEGHWKRGDMVDVEVKGMGHFEGTITDFGRSSMKVDDRWFWDNEIEYVDTVKPVTEPKPESVFRLPVDLSYRSDDPTVKCGAIGRLPYELVGKEVTVVVGKVAHEIKCNEHETWMSLSDGDRILGTQRVLPKNALILIVEESQ